MLNPIVTIVFEILIVIVAILVFIMSATNFKNTKNMLYFALSVLFVEILIYQADKLYNHISFMIDETFTVPIFLGYLTVEKLLFILMGSIFLWFTGYLVNMRRFFTLVLKSATNNIPIHQLPESFDIVRTFILIVKVIGMFPDIARKDGFQSIGHWIPGIGCLYDIE